MGTKIDRLTESLDHLLKADATEGLILKRAKYVEKIACSLDLSPKVIQKVEEKSADFLIVFNPHIKPKLLKNVNFSTYISETPLKTSEFANAERYLADKLGITIEGSIEGDVLYGNIELNDLSSFKDRIMKLTGQKPKIKKKKGKIGKIALGGNINDKDWLEKAKEVGVETILTVGNPLIFSKKNPMNIIYKTKRILEITSILKLGEILEKKFNIEFFFIN